MRDFEKPDFIVKLEKYTDTIIQNGDEPEMLAKLQQTIKEYDIKDVDPFNKYAKYDCQFDIDEAIGELEQSRIIAEMLLLRSWVTFKSSKYLYIFTSTLNMIKCYRTKNDYPSIIEESEHVYLYLEDAVETSPDDFNIISVICEIFYQELNARLKIGNSIKAIQNRIDEYIPFLIVAADKDKYKLHASLILGQIGDVFLSQERYIEACLYYPQVIHITSQITELGNKEKRELAIFLDHYNVALFGCEPKDWGKIERYLDMEESLDEQLHEFFGDIRSKMELAIVYSHKGDYYANRNDFKSASDCNFKKIQLIFETFQIEDDTSEYPEAARLDSLFKSMQSIINYGLLSNGIERIKTFKRVYAKLYEFLNCIFDIRILQFLNAFAMEIFKASDGINDKDAEDYLFKKISVLVNLIVDYGEEEGIISDLQQTIKDGRSFVTRMGERLQEHNKQVWEAVNKVV